MTKSISPWRHPAPFPFAAVLNVIANSALLRAIGHALPTPALSSDITDVVYVNYLVEADRLASLVQSPLELQRLGPGGRYALFSFLTFRHGHFGPAFFGRFRRFWISPIQTNWRIHVVNPATGTRGVQFFSTAIASTPHAITARLLTDGVPMHVPRAASLVRGPGGVRMLTMEPGRGSAPDLRVRVAPSAEPTLGDRWKECFPTWRDFLAYCVPQDRAMTVTRGRVVRQEIVLDIPLDSCIPLDGEVESQAARRIAGDARPHCFLVERVGFHFTRQEWDR